MSKERLEGIKVKVNNTEYPMLYVPYEDIEFLIEQAERVHELEKELETTKQMLEDEIKYCRELMG